MSQASTGGAAGEEMTMGYSRCVGRVGASALATRTTVSIGAAVLVVTATVVPVPAPVPVAGVDGVAGRAAGGDERAVYAHRRNVCLDLGRHRRSDARRRLHRDCQEPVHRAYSSRPGDQLRRGDDTRGVVARHRGRPPPRARARTSDVRAWWP